MTEQFKHMTEQFKKAEQPLSNSDKAQQALDTFVNNPGLTEMADLFGVKELPEDPRGRLLELQKIALGGETLRFTK